MEDGGRWGKTSYPGTIPGQASFSFFVMTKHKPGSPCPSTKEETAEGEQMPSDDRQMRWDGRMGSMDARCLSTQAINISNSTKPL